MAPLSEADVTARKPMLGRVITPTGALRAWWAVLMVMVAAGLTAGACIAFTVHTERETARQSCGLLVILDKPLPPTAPQRSREILREIHAWRVRAGC